MYRWKCIFFSVDVSFLGDNYTKTFRDLYNSLKRSQQNVLKTFHLSQIGQPSSMHWMQVVNPFLLNSIYNIFTRGIYTKQIAIGSHD